MVAEPGTNADANLDALEQRLGYHFTDRRLLVTALRHRSYVYENPEQDQSDNERLEFLGDAALDLALSHLLLERFPHANEGVLTRLRAGLVNERRLAELAARLHLGSVLYLGRGEDRSGGRHKPSLLADAYEALLAAVYLDGGLQALLQVVEKHFAPLLVDDGEPGLDQDYKTRLQEVVQARDKTLPVYRLEAEEGPDHRKVFTASVWLQDRLIALGIGPSKKAAQQQAARRALEILQPEGNTP